jgi:hypothetical protein
MQISTRPVLLGIAFAALVAGGVSALTLRGETKEAGFIEDACAKAAWPLIPAKCLDGARGDVRVIADRTSAAEQVSDSPTIEVRFNSDFE